MMTQGVMTQAVNLFGNATGSVTSKGKQAGNSFELMFHSGIKPEQNVAGSTGNTEVKRTSQQSSDKNSNKLSDASDESTKQANNTTRSADANEATKASTQAQGQTQNTGNESEVKADDTDKTDPIVDDKTMEKITCMLQAIQQTIMEVLNLSEEELSQLMTEQGLSMEDLLQPDNLQQLILADYGQNDILAALTDENLANTMKQLMQSVEDIKTEADLGIPMELVKSIQNSVIQQKEISTVIPTEAQVEKVVTNSILQGKEIVEPGKNEKEDETLVVNKSESQKEIGIDQIEIRDNKNGNSQSQADLHKENDQKLQATKQYEMFLNNLTNAATSTQVDFDGNMMKVTQLREIANQIIETIKVSIQPDQTSMELQLNPENLGKVNFSVQSKNGILTAQFVVQNDISKEAIESQLQSLKETFNQQGIKVEAIDVTVASYSFDQNGNEQTGTQEEAKKGNSGGRISLEDALTMTDGIEEQAETNDVTGVRGSQIDYTA